MPTGRQFDIAEELADEPDGKSALLQDAMGALVEGFALFDARLHFLTCNEKYLNLACSNDVEAPKAGETAEDIFHRQLTSDKFTIPSGSSLKELCASILDVARSQDREVELTCSDGRAISISFSTTGRGGVLASVLDITKRKQAEKAEHDANALLKTIIEACPANLLVSRIEDGEVLFRSEASRELFGKQPTARGHWKNPSDRTKYLKRLSENGRVDDLFVEGRKSDGTVFPSQVSARIVKHGGEEVIVSSTTDLTEALVLRDERNQANARLRDAIEVLDEGFVLYDQNKCLVMANSQYANMLGPHKGLLVPGTPMAEIIGPAVATGHVTIVNGPKGGIAGIFEALEQQKRLRLEVKIADGTQRLITLGSLDDGGIIASVLDITDQRTTEARAREMLGGAIEDVDFGIALIDEESRLVFANEQFRTIGDPGYDLFVPGTKLRDIHKNAIDAGLFPLPEGMSEETLLNHLDALVSRSDKGFQLPNEHNRELIGSVYETALGGRLLTIEDRTDQRLTERLFSDVVALLPVGLAIETANGQLSHCNEAFASPFGYTSGELLKLSAQERFETLAPKMVTIMGEDVSNDPIAAFGKAVLKQRETSRPMEVSMKDGRHFMVERAATLGESRVVVATDITALKEADAYSLSVLNDAIQSLDLALVLFDSNLSWVMANQRWHNMFFSDLPSPEAGESIIDMTARLIEVGVILIPDGLEKEGYLEALMHEVRTFGKDTTLHLSDGSTWLASVHQTGLDGYLISFADVTEQRRAEQEQREADMLLRKIVEACPANFLVSRVDDGKIIYCPPASRERFGDIESTLSFFLSPDDRVRYLDALLPTGSLDDYRVQFKRADGSIMQGLTAARVTDYKGENVIVSSTRDISDQLEMQAELEKQRDIAHQNEKLSALGELLAGVAHELNNPLSIVVGYAQMLQGKIDDPVLAKRVDRIAQAADRSAKIVKTFLAMARQRPTKIEHCSLNDIATIALEVAGYGLRANGTQTQLELDEDLPLVSGDPDQLVQVFTNLIVNAEHVLAPIREEGQLTIRSYYDTKGDHSVLEIEDNGPGIPSSIQSRIFEPFFTTKEVGKGTGVGLAFSHRIIDTHGGVLDVKSDGENGTSFYVRLRSVKPELIEDQSQETPEEITPYDLLVIDDEVGVGELIQDLLSEIGCTSHVCSDAEDALKLLPNRKFDAIISDFKMPGLNGEEFYHIIKTDFPEYADRVGFITGDTMSQTVSQFFSKSARPYVEKPISSDELKTLVQRLVGEGADRQ